MEQQVPAVDGQLSTVLAGAIQRQRSQVQAFAASHRERLAEVEALLAQQLGAIAEEASAAVRCSFDQQQSELALLRRELADVTATHQAALEAAMSQQDELRRQAEFQQQSLSQREDELNAAHAAATDLTGQLAQLHETCARLEQELSSRDVAASSEDNPELLQQQRRELEARSIELAVARDRVAQLEEELASMHSRGALLEEELGSVRREFERLEGTLSHHLRSANAALEEQRGLAAARAAELEQSQAEAALWRQESEAYRARQTELEIRLAEQAELSSSAEQELRTTLELRQAELNDARHRADSLKGELEAARATGERLKKQLAASQTSASAFEVELRRQLEARAQEVEDLRGQKETLQDELESHQSQLERLKKQLAEQINSSAAAEQERRQALEQRTADLREARKQLEALKDELQARQSSIERLKRQLGESSAAAVASESERLQMLEQRTAEVRDARQQAETLRDELEKLQSGYEQLRKQLAASAAALATAESERRRMAEQHSAESRASAQHAEALQQELDALRELAAQHENCLSDRLANETDHWRARCEKLEHELQSCQAAADHSENLAQQHFAECGALQARLNELEEQLAARPDSSDSTQLRDLEQRYQMAITDLRSERARIAELEKKIAHGGGRSPVSPMGGDAMDWESQKRRLLESLESDFDSEDEQQAGERLKIEDAIRATDKAVAEKDREIAELRQILEEQSSNWGSVAVGAAAIAETLDKDEIIQQERESLRKIQEEWREKLGKAEIELSLERAKIARERSDLDEKLRVLQQEQARRGAVESSGPRDEQEPKGNRWWAQLRRHRKDEG